jgi:hypothetical protein
MYGADRESRVLALGIYHHPQNFGIEAHYGVTLAANVPNKAV